MVPTYTGVKEGLVKLRNWPEIRFLTVTGLGFEPKSLSSKCIHTLAGTSLCPHSD